MEQEPKADRERSVRLEMEFYRKDGSTVWLENVVTGIRDANQTIVGVHGVARDITERRQAQEALRASEERFRTLIEKATDVVVVLDANGRTSYQSPSLQRITGYEPHEWVDKSLTDFFLHPDDLAPLAAALERVLAQPGAALEDIHARYRHKDGSWRFLEGTVTNMLHDPKVNGLVANFRDVTERRQAGTSAEGQRG